MNLITKFSVTHRWLAWFLIVLFALGTGGLASEFVRQQQIAERFSLLQTESERQGIEIMSQTLNGNLMGALGLMGTINPELKREARGEVLGKLKGERAVEAKGKPLFVSELSLANLESIGRSYDTEGAFLVRNDGLISAAWYTNGKPSFGANVKFRPYYQMAMQGIENVYAAVGTGNGERILYFSAPVFAENTSATETIGAIVARVGLHKIDNLLRDKADIALLLSPQDVVFASSKPEWVARIAGEASAERLQAIRDVKQFGDLFNDKPPLALPVVIQPGIQDLDGKPFAVASASVQWNDPMGDWKLVLLEDLSRTVPLASRFKIGGALFLLMLTLGALMLRMLHSQHAQIIAAQQLNAFARTQEAAAGRKTQQAAAAVAMQQANSLSGLVQVFLEQAHELFGALQGVVYVADAAASQLQLAGSYACAKPPPPSQAYGDGLLGQCAIERRGQLIATDTARITTVRSGLGESAPAAILLAPILLNEVLVGVVEIAMLRIPDAAEQLQFEELVALLGMSLEIVGRNERNEQALSLTRESERDRAEQLTFQQALVDTIPYPVFYKGPDTCYLGFNRAYEETFKVKRDALIGKRVIDLEYLPEGDRIAFQAEDEAVIASAASIKREIRLPFADGQMHDTLYYVCGFRRPDGSPGGLVGTFIDVGALKQAEREMDRMSDMERFNQLAQGREHRVLELKREVNQLAEKLGMAPLYTTSLVETVADHEFTPHPDYRTTLDPVRQDLQLADLVDLDDLQRLLVNFCESVGIAAAIIDPEGKVLASARWQRACVDYHRVSPDSCARCIESDTELALQLKDGQDFTMYKCKNGMTDAAAPIIVEGQHLANVFIGQFHSAPPDEEFFRAQARQFGYDENGYLDAIRAVPVIKEARLPAILGFLSGFSRMISTLSLARRRADQAQKILEQQAAMLHRERIAALGLAEDAEQARKALEALSKEVQA